MSMQEANGFKGYQSMEDYLLAQSDGSFPNVNSSGGEKSYPEKYADLKKALIPVHNVVEKGAMLQSIVDHRKALKKEIEELEKIESHETKERLMHLKELFYKDPIIYLNQHGTGHVDKVIQRVFELACNFKFGFLTPSETFLLLCAIQVHDVGNMFGRKDHERSAQKAVTDIIRPFIPDTPTRNLFFKIAQVHSGQINGNRDTIAASKLRIDGSFFDKPIREPLLAALLRFGDELADDSSRADLLALDLGKIPAESIIYHEYSKSLHTVKIEKNEVNQTLYLSLEYYIDSSMITTTFLKDDANNCLSMRFLHVQSKSNKSDGIA